MFQSQAGVSMKMISITPMSGERYAVRVYEADHLAASRKSSAETAPLDSFLRRITTSQEGLTKPRRRRLTCERSIDASKATWWSFNPFKDIHSASFMSLNVSDPHIACQALCAPDLLDSILMCAQYAQMTNNNTKEFKTFLRAWRLFRGYTLEEVEAAIGYTYQHILRVEKDETAYTPDFLQALANFYKVSRGDLLDRDPNDPRVQMIDLATRLTPEEAEFLRAQISGVLGARP